MLKILTNDNHSSVLCVSFSDDGIKLNNFQPQLKVLSARIEELTTTVVTLTASNETLSDFKVKAESSEKLCQEIQQKLKVMKGGLKEALEH